MPLAKSNMSFSTSELPISIPFAFKKVKAMPPPIMTLSTRLPKFSMTPIFPDTFAPPRMATKGRTGFSTAPSRYTISFLRRKPAAEAEMNLVMPTVEA